MHKIIHKKYKTTTKETCQGWRDGSASKNAYSDVISHTPGSAAQGGAEKGELLGPACHWPIIGYFHAE